MKQVVIKKPSERLEFVLTRHRQLDARLSELVTRRAYLTPSEQFEVAQLKKKKLRVKDEIATLRTVLD